MNLGTGGIEVLKLQFSDITTIHRIRPFASELLHVEVMGTHTNLFIGIEGDTDLTVLDVLMFLQVHHCLHNLGNASLVVST